MSEQGMLDGLIIDLANTSRLLKETQDRKLKIESDIYELVQKDLTKQGSNHVHPRLKVVLKNKTAWDQVQLQHLAAKTPPNLFPFKIEYKPDGKTLTALETIAPDTFKDIMKAATITDAKPSFELIEE